MPRPQSYSVIVIVALSAALLGSIGSQSLRGQAGTGLKPPVIALLNVTKVISKLDERTALEADLQAMTEKIQKESQERQTEIKAIQADLAILNPETDAYQSKQDEGLKLSYEYEAWQKLMTATNQREQAIMLENLYNKVVNAAERMSLKEGIDLVLADDRTPPLKVKTQQAIAQVMNIRKVIYAKDWLVVTDQIAQQMNNEFNNQ